MQCIRHDQRPWVGNESNRAIRWGALGAYGNDSQEVVAAIGSCPLHLPSVMPPSFINQPLCTFMPWLKWQKVLQCGHFHQKIKVWPSCQLCQHFFTSIIPVGSNVTPLIKGEWLLILPHKAFHPRVLESAVTPPNYSTTDLRLFSIFTMQDPFGSQVCANIQYRKSAIQCPEQWWEVMISRSLKMLRFFWSARTP